MSKNVIKLRASDIEKTSAWGGYNQTYIKTIITSVLKALKLLSIITFDPGLFFWSKGLEHHLEKRMEEAAREAEESKNKYKF